MLRYYVLLLASLLLSASLGALGESIRGSANDQQDLRELATNLDEMIGDEPREFMFFVRLSTDKTLEQVRSCVDRDSFDMGAIILSVLRTAFLDLPVEFKTINFLKAQSGRRNEEGHRQLKRYGYSGGGCSRCKSNSGARRDLAVGELGLNTVGEIISRMQLALDVAIKQTFLAIRTDSCLSGLSIQVKTSVRFY